MYLVGGNPHLCRMFCIFKKPNAISNWSCWRISFLIKNEFKCSYEIMRWHFCLAHNWFKKALATIAEVTSLYSHRWLTWGHMGSGKPDCFALSLVSYLRSRSVPYLFQNTNLLLRQVRVRGDLLNEWKNNNVITSCSYHAFFVHFYLFIYLFLPQMKPRITS